MAEENHGFMPEMSDTDTLQPPIDNIHNSINNEPEIPVQLSNEPQFPPPPMTMGEQQDTDMTDSAVSLHPPALSVLVVN